MVATILAPNKKKAVMWVRNLEPGLLIELTKMLHAQTTKINDAVTKQAI